MLGNQQLGFVWQAEDSTDSYASDEGVVQREVDRWIEDEVKFRTKSRDTWRGKRSQIRAFHAWCLQRGVLRVEDLTRDVLRDYLRQSREDGYALSSLRTRAAILRSWLSWLAEEGLIARVPRIETPKPERELPRIPTPEQIETILQACEDRTPYGHRDRTLILFLYGSGCRVSEASKLEMSDLELDQSRARVMGKGARRRIAALTSRAVEALGQYIQTHRFPAWKPKDVDAVFTTRHGTRMSRDMIGRAIKQRCRRAGLPWVHAHLLRHAAATHLLNSGADLRRVQEVLGHVAITSTQIYTHVSVEQMAQTVERFHPHARP